MNKLTFYILLSFVFFSFKSFSLKSDSLDILNYDIRLKVNLSIYNIKGYTELKINPKKNNISKIALDLLKLNIDSITSNGIILTYNYNDTLIIIDLNNSYNQTDTFYVKVYYNGKPVTDPSGFGGFYFSSGYAYNLGVGFQDNPHNYGRVWYPCFDDFIDRATYDCHINVPLNYKAICGGVLQNTTQNPDTSTTFYWRLNQEIPTYLSSIAVGIYSHITDTFAGINGNIPIDIYVRPTDSLKTINSFVNLNAALSAYEYFFGPYKWDRVGYVGVPFNGGAMEHATSIAYPNFALTGSLAYESLMAHELSHHWFGNLITCSTPEDMWINEGWASYCEPIFEEIVYGKDHAKLDIRALHEKNIRYLHIEDNGYRAVYGIPHNYTYSSTVYEKGAGVAHSIRGYLGDSLFIVTMKSLLEAYSYKDISSIEMRDFISNYTGIDMNGFFDAYVFSPGYMHYSIDSFKVEQLSQQYKVKLYSRLKNRGNNHIANGNKVEVTFLDENWNKITKIVRFDGEIGVDSFIIAINPKLSIFDIDEKLCDATTDNYKTIKTTGQQSFDRTYFIADVVSVTDSAFLRVEHSWVAPDNFKYFYKGLIISKERYWKIDGLFPNGFYSKGKFYYSKTASASNGYLDRDLILNSVDSLVLLYRKSTNDDWEITPFTKAGNTLYGYLISDTLKNGEYALGIKHSSRLKAVIENNSCNGIGSLKSIIEGGTAPYSYLWNTNETTSNISSLNQGKYSLTVVDSNNDSVKINYWLRIPTILSSEIIAPILLKSDCNTQVVVNVLGGVPPYTYLWSDSLSQDSNIVNLCEGKYYVTITDRLTCVLIDSVDITNNINEIALFNKIQLFPNPVNNKLHIKTDLNNYKLSVYCILGEKLFENNNLINGSTEVDCSKLKEGFYILQLKTESTEKKFIFIKSN